MHKLRIYIDTSVIGGCFDEEFQKWSNILFDDILAGKIIAVVSDLTIKEIENAPEQVKEIFRKIINSNTEIIDITDEIEELANKYVESRAISEKFKEDSIHIAAATICNVDALVSWNFKHIVNIARIRKYNAVNLFNGYKVIDIVTPLEVIHEED